MLHSPVERFILKEVLKGTLGAGAILGGLREICMPLLGQSTNRTDSFRRALQWMPVIALCAAALVATEKPTIDDLEQRLPEAVGAARLEILNELSNGLCLRAPDAAIDYGRQAVDLARELGDRDAEGYALKSIGIAYAVVGDQHTSLEHSEQALAIFESIDNPIQMGKVLNNMGICYRMLDDAERAIECYSRAMEIEKELDNPKGIARTLGNIANVYLDQSRYEEALAAHDEGLEIARGLGDQDLIASSLNNIGIIHYEQGRYQEALSHQLQALEIREASGDVLAAAGHYFNIANIKVNIGQHDEALAMYEKTLVAAEETGDRVRAGRVHNAIGNLLIGLEDHRGAAERYTLARQIFAEAEHRSGLADTSDNLGICERAFGNLEKALEYHREALAIREEIGGQRAIANTCNNIGRVLGELGRMEEAEPFLLRGLEIATAVDAKEIIKESTWHLSRLEKMRGDFKLALQYLEEHGEVKDQLLDEFTRDAVARAEARFEAQKRDQEIALLQKENEIQRLEASRATLRTRLLLVVLAAVVVVLVLFVRRYRYLFTFWKRRSYVGHYKIIDQIASGGMGVVYRAENVVEGSRSFALKVIREEHAGDEIVRRRFLHEAAVVDQLDHPHIVAVHERGEHEGRLFMAMELLEGRSLAEIIHDNSAALSVPECRHIMRQLIDVVMQIHVKGVLHRDLKPDNVMVVEHEDDPHYVKLLDFGLARTQSLTRLTQSGLVVGTIGYLAPEQLTEQKSSTASDIYALGVIFYELLTRQPAFPGDTPVDIIKQILEASPVPPKKYRPEIGVALNDLILSMMEKDPEARPEGSAIAELLDRPD